MYAEKFNCETVFFFFYIIAKKWIKIDKNDKSIKIGYFQMAGTKNEEHHHIMFSSPNIILQSYKPKNKVKKFDNRNVWLLRGGHP